MATQEANSEPTIRELFDMHQRTAIVTGAGGYVGSALARALAEAGARLAVTSRDVQRANEVARSLPIPSNSGPHIGAELDQTNPDSIDRCIATILQQVGTVDVLVNNAHEPLGKDWQSVTPAEFQSQLENLTGYFLLARHVRNHAISQNRAASIIMLGSMYGVVGSYPDAYDGLVQASPAAYHALKGGIVQLTRHLSVYWAKDRVRVNCLSPGPFPSESTNPQMVERLIAKSPMRRMGNPHELKGALLLLASDAGSYITGQNLIVDGGWTSW